MSLCAFPELPVWVLEHVLPNLTNRIGHETGVQMLLAVLFARCGALAPRSGSLMPHTREEMLGHMQRQRVTEELRQGEGIEEKGIGEIIR